MLEFPCSQAHESVGLLSRNTVGHILLINKRHTLALALTIIIWFSICSSLSVTKTFHSPTPHPKLPPDIWRVPSTLAFTFSVSDFLISTAPPAHLLPGDVHWGISHTSTNQSDSTGPTSSSGRDIPSGFPISVNTISLLSQAQTVEITSYSFFSLIFYIYQIPRSSRCLLRNTYRISVPVATPWLATIFTTAALQSPRPHALGQLLRSPHTPLLQSF